MTGIASSLAGRAKRKPIRIAPFMPSSSPAPSSVRASCCRRLMPLTCTVHSTHRISPAGAATSAARESTCSVLPKIASVRIFLGCGRR